MGACSLPLRYLVLLIPLSQGQTPEDTSYCCKTKELNGNTYDLVEYTYDLPDYGCNDGCIYRCRETEEIVCFGPGYFPPQCVASTNYTKPISVDESQSALQTATEFDSDGCYILQTGPYGGPGGSPFSDEEFYDYQGPLTHIRLQNGLYSCCEPPGATDLIQQIRFSYGGVNANTHGTNDYIPTITETDVTDLITAVEIYYGTEFGQFVNHLKFVQKDGTPIPDAEGQGSKTGKHTYQTAPCPGGHLAYISGHSGEVLDSLLLNWKCCGPAPVCHLRKNVTTLSTLEKNGLNVALQYFKSKGRDELKGFNMIGRYHGRRFLCNKDQTGIATGILSDDNGCCISHWGQGDGLHDPHPRRDLFSPWHRLYMYNFEQSLVNGRGLGDLGLPYWDWTEGPTYFPDLPSFPTSYSEWQNGQYYDDSDILHTTYRSPSNIYPTRLLKQLVRLAYCMSTWHAYSIQIVQPHNHVHVNVGGQMGAPSYSSFDPIFYLHHSNVDLQFAYYEELARLRSLTLDKNSFVSPSNPEFQMFPFASAPYNPYPITYHRSKGYKTFGTEHFHACYDDLKFDGMSPQEFHEKNLLVCIIYLMVGSILYEHGPSSVISFSLLNKDGLQIENVASQATFGSGDDVSDVRKSITTALFVVDVENITSSHPNLNLSDPSIHFSVSSYETVNGTELPLSETVKPLAVAQDSTTGSFTYRIHSGSASEYSSKMRILPGSTLEVVNQDGVLEAFTEDVEGETVNHDSGTLAISFENHKLKINGADIELGHDPLYWCEDGVPVVSPYAKYDPVEVLFWGDGTLQKYGTIHVNLESPKLVFLTWCEGLNNVVDLSEEDWNNCQGLNEDGARPGPQSYLVPNLASPGTLFLASGIGSGTACEAGNKIKIVYQ